VQPCVFSKKNCQDDTPHFKGTERGGADERGGSEENIRRVGRGMSMGIANPQCSA